MWLLADAGANALGQMRHLPEREDLPRYLTRDYYLARSSSCPNLMVDIGIPIPVMKVPQEWRAACSFLGGRRAFFKRSCDLTPVF